MLLLCFGAKGGVGTTTVASSLALDDTAPAVLVDLVGDVPLVLGVAADRPGVADWLASDAPTDRLDDLLVDATSGLHLLAAGGRVEANGRRVPPDADTFAARGEEFAAWLAGRVRAGARVVVDAGRLELDATVAAAADRSLLVTRNCYLALTAARTSPPVDGLVMIREPGRAIRRRDAELAVGAPVLAEPGLDPAVARLVDAGLARGPLPRPWRRAMSALWSALTVDHDTAPPPPERAVPGRAA